MATPPRSMAEKPASAPDSLPMGVRADETMTDPGIGPPPRLPPRRVRAAHASERWYPSLRVLVPSWLTGETDPGPGYFAGMSADQVAAIRDAIVEGADAETIAGLPLPAVYRAAVVRASEQEMFAGLASEDKDPRRSLHLD